jgi:ABC-2 type transport system ATP-binding protein
MTVLLSSHLLGQVQSVCDRVGIFAAGKLIGVGTVAELAERFGDGAAHVEVTFADEGGEEARSADPAAVLGAIPHVDAVTREGPSAAWRLIVRPVEASGEVREGVLRTVLEHGLRLTSMRVLEPSLDDIYRTAVAAMPHAGVMTEVGA